MPPRAEAIVRHIANHLVPHKPLSPYFARDTQRKNQQAQEQLAREQTRQRIKEHNAAAHKKMLSVFQETGVRLFTEGRIAKIHGEKLEYFSPSEQDMDTLTATDEPLKIRSLGYVLHWKQRQHPEDKLHQAKNYEVSVLYHVEDKSIEIFSADPSGEICMQGESTSVSSHSGVRSVVVRLETWNSDPIEVLTKLKDAFAHPVSSTSDYTYSLNTTIVTE